MAIYIAFVSVLSIPRTVTNADLPNWVEIPDSNIHIGLLISPDDLATRLVEVIQHGIYWPVP